MTDKKQIDPWLRNQIKNAIKIIDEVKDGKHSNKWVNYYTDPEERVPRMFDPDHPVLDDEDDFYDEEEYDEQSRD